MSKKYFSKARVWNTLFGLKGCLFRFFVLVILLALWITLRTILGIFQGESIYAAFVFICVYALPVYFMAKYIHKKWMEWQDPEAAAERLLASASEDLKNSPSLFRTALKKPRFGLSQEPYHPYVLDAFTSSGWLPRYWYYVSPVPSVMNLGVFAYPLQKVYFRLHSQFLFE